MVKLSEHNFRFKVTRINRRSIDKLVKLTDSYREDISETMRTFIQADEDLDTATFHSLVEFPALEFSLYALAIIHCYSILENNRKLICEGIRGISNSQKENLHKIEFVEEVLKSINIAHTKLKCQKTMNEFREVNNAIKHNRFGLDTAITTKSQKKYEARQLKGLYLNKAKYLESYLSDLFERTKAQRL